MPAAPAIISPRQAKASTFAKPAVRGALVLYNQPFQYRPDLPFAFFMRSAFRDDMRSGHDILLRWEHLDRTAFAVTGAGNTFQIIESPRRGGVFFQASLELLSADLIDKLQEAQGRGRLGCSISFKTLEWKPVRVGDDILMGITKATFREASLSVMPRMDATFAKVIDASQEPGLGDAIRDGILDRERERKALLSRMTDLTESVSGRPVDLPDFRNFRRKAA